MYRGNQIKTAALLGLLSGILVLGGYWATGNEQGAFIGLILAAISSFGSWFYSDKAALFWQWFTISISHPSPN